MSSPASAAPPGSSGRFDADPASRRSSHRRHQFEDLFARHGTAVYAYARRRSTADDAEEVVADTFLVAWRRLDTVPGEALPWLLAVARRTLANKRRGDDRRTALHLRLTAAAGPESPGPSESVMPGDDELGDRVTGALNSLPPGEYDALTLLAWDGLTPAEVWSGLRWKVKPVAGSCAIGPANSVAAIAALPPVREEPEIDQRGIERIAPIDDQLIEAVFQSAEETLDAPVLPRARNRAALMFDAEPPKPETEQTRGHYRLVVRANRFGYAELLGIKRARVELIFDAV